MPQLLNESKNNIAVKNLRIATTMLERMIGLLGTSKIEKDQGLWIQKCNSVHTFFMKFPIDAVFLNHEMKVVKVYHQLAPWKITLPNLKYKTVVELAAGQALALKIEEGDQLHVGS